MNKKRKIGILILIVLFIVGLLSGIYFGSYYHADETALQVMEETKETVSVSSLKDGTIVFTPDNPTAGFIFYPGGKVENTSYAPLMEQCAEQGILCVLLKMPFNLAIFDIEAATSIPNMYPEIETWVVGGHSLGGASAAMCVSKNEAIFDGLVLLGAYSTKDLSESSVRVLSIYGSQDGVMNRENYAKYLSNLPTDFEEIIIEGGCHCYFGNYGWQKGDGEASIQREEQILFTAESIVKFISSVR